MEIEDKSLEQRKHYPKFKDIPEGSIFKFNTDKSSFHLKIRDPYYLTIHAVNLETNHGYEPVESAEVILYRGKLVIFGLDDES